MKKIYFLVFTIAIFFLSRLLFLEFNFWGLEYEDSFIYYDNALNFENHILNKENIFQCISCDIGSYKDCISYLSYGAHYTTFAYVVYNFNKIFGSDYINIFLLNLIITFGILMAFYTFEKEKGQRVIFTLILSLTPFYPLFSTTGNSEIFSSLFVFLCLILTSQYFKKGSNKYFYYFLLCASIASISNRENFILFIIFAIILLFYKVKYHLHIAFNIIAITLTSLLLTLILGVYDTEMEYSSDIGSSTFSLKYLFDNTVAFFKGMMSFELWGISGVLLIISIFLFFFKKESNKFIYLVVLFIGSYYLVTFLHYRHYNYLLTGRVTPFETLRYTTTFFPLIAIFISYYLNLIYLKYSDKTIIASALIIPILIYQTFETRKNFSNDEKYSRIEPVLEVLRIHEKNDLIVTEFPIVAKIYAKENAMVADLRSLKNVKIDDFKRIYFLLGKDHTYEIPKSFRLKKIKEINEYNIYILEH
ncbi:hypothetical protein [Kaistella jeonii]|uniref:Glycosyltransferase RgtA/B/C/D-like domain-containing protein n=1 Tax=Kaistella jeonii TaxID=266749 RepID=A0A0C1CVX1_9FLAO|nr:hypothetical protein [Kaistella jeonii]KIA88491.1 hypothetical protein OA86_10675 [Kaistella jeonii]SFC18309.1 hypothetical protein SAMN05421876_10898 [Kaistella jeonii]VEI95461.1 Predicted membrane protein [Kaistella jeonii]